MTGSNDTSLDAVLEVMEIDPLDIELEYTTIGPQIARYNELHVEALREQLYAEREVKRVRAKKQLFIRAKASDSGDKMTDSRANAKVEASQIVQKVEIAAIDARIERERLRGILKTLEGKRDMLVSLGAHIRAEMQGNPSLREQYRAQRDDEEDD
ncbi:hypothetical protein LCGC14_0672950 [marine sediment metagenome]|uniref:Uncharacterized protein n=1 Tax=marine sediment metagenome TaxID=412755 RepID=A0A0F9QQJ4_9ZZZZ